MTREMTKSEREEAAAAAVTSVPWAIWLSSGVVIVLLLFGTVMLMVTPADSLSQYRPLVRTREAHQSAPALTSTESTTTDEEVQQRIMEIYNRKGYSNPDPDPEDNPEDTSSDIGTRIDHPHPVRRRTRRPMQKIGKDFDPNQSYVIKHRNGTIAYVFPANITASQSSEGTDDYIKIPDQKNNTVHYRTSGSNSSDIVFPPELETKIDETTCTTQNPWCSGIRTADENLIIDQIMASHKHRFAGVFGEDVAVGDGILQTRFDTSDDIPICTPRERIIHPQYGFTREKKNLTIVNTENYIQGVRVEYCDGPGKPCNGLERIMTTECKQMYHFRTLLAIHPDTKKPFKEQFKLPSCCKCVRKLIKSSDAPKSKNRW